MLAVSWRLTESGPEMLESICKRRMLISCECMPMNVGCCAQVTIELSASNFLFVALRCIASEIAQGGTILGETNKDVRAGSDPCTESHNADGCRALADSLVRIGGKWTVVEVGALAKGSMRYSEIFKLIEGVSHRMLILTLNRLDRDALVNRTTYRT